MNEDSVLLQRFARDGSEAAFAELVQRTTGLVYSAALRQVGGDRALAAEVCQSVFVDLARKARQLAGRPVLASWLFTSTRYAALKALRGRRRRQQRERAAHAMQEIDRTTPGAADWEKVRPLLDSALCDLAERDRTPILLRYFEGRSYAELGARLEVGENTARMRADRALEKLRLAFAQKGIHSTVAALGVALSTQAVAAPPAGLAPALAQAALAKAATMGGGAGLLAKLWPFASLNKTPASYAAVATLGAASFAGFEVGGGRFSTSFVVYAVCFGVGLLFTLLSAITGHIFGGHGEDFSHDFGGHDGADGGHANGHAEAGASAHDMPGFAPLSPTTIATFITAFGGLGMIMEQIRFLQSPWISVPIAAGGAFGIAALVFLLFRLVFQRTQASSEGRVVDLVGLEATVITPIAHGAVGEIAYVQAGSRYSAPARSDDGSALPSGSAVRITRVVGTQFYVVRD